MYRRPIGEILLARLKEAPRRIQILAGPRQVGKTTLIRDLLSERDSASASYLSPEPGDDSLALADSRISGADIAPPQSPQANSAWLIDRWQRADADARAWHARQAILDGESPTPYVLVIDEIQKIPNWSEAVKGLWDVNLRATAPMHVVLLGSSPLLMQKGLSESLAGRFELIRATHWSFEEMNDAFGWTLDQYLYFGGYPGSHYFLADELRWRNYVRDALIRPSIDKDVRDMARVDQPALLQQLFEVGCRYSGQIVALDKVLGVLKSKGNTVTLARYLELLDRAGLLRGMHKFSDHEVRRRRSPPKFNVLNTALMSALGAHSFSEARADRSYWGRLVESAVGAYLCNAADASMAVHYWREGPLEVDFVVGNGKKLLAIEVKSGDASGPKLGLEEFQRRHRGSRCVVVGGDEYPVGEFLRQPISHWFER
jgi:predicted AAA+ superfamily ATPase